MWLSGLEVAQIASQSLDRTRSLWELWVIEGLAEGWVVLVFRAHHAIADGVSAIQLLLRLLDPSPEGADVPTRQTSHSGSARRWATS